MKKLFTLSSAVVLSAALAAAVSAQETKPADPAKPKADETKKADSAVLSKWEVSISAPGQDYAGVLKLEKTADGFKGSLTTELGEAPLANVKVEGDGFTAAISLNAMGQNIEGTVNGKAKDGKISGDLNLTGLGVIPYTGKKQ